jgi:hypothetical protein
VARGAEKAELHDSEKSSRFPDVFFPNLKQEKGTVYTRQKPDYFPRFFLGWFPSCVNFQKVEFGLDIGW